MLEKNDEINEIVNSFLSKVKKQYKVDSVYLYGSFAKGKAWKWSDIDLAVISQDFHEDLFEVRLKLMKIAASVDDRIEPYPFKDQYFNRNDPLVNEICEHGIRIV